MFHTDLAPHTLDQATIDHYVAKGKRIRWRAIVEMVKALFSKPEPNPAQPAGCPA